MKKVATTLAGAMLVWLLVFPVAAADKDSWPAETLAGTISMVEPGQHVVVVKSQDNVPFDMVITPKTHIMCNNQAVTLKDLSQYQNKNVSVRFVPEGRGDIAESIRING